MVGELKRKKKDLAADSFMQDVQGLVAPTVAVEVSLNATAWFRRERLRLHRGSG